MLDKINVLFVGGTFYGHQESMSLTNPLLQMYLSAGHEALSISRNLQLRLQNKSNCPSFHSVTQHQLP